MLQKSVTTCTDCPLHVLGRCAFAPRKHQADTVLTSQGSAPAELAFVRQGVVALSAVNSQSVQTWTALRGPRSMLGLEAMTGARSEVEVRALTEVELCTATTSSVATMMQAAEGSNALLRLAVTEVLAQRSDTNLRTGSIEGRVARVALLSERLISRKGHARPLSKARVASLIGIRPETFSRVLRRFSDRGLIDASEGIRVLVPSVLEAIAQT